jgi:hypothetical protein
VRTISRQRFYINETRRKAGFAFYVGRLRMCELRPGRGHLLRIADHAGDILSKRDPYPLVSSISDGLRVQNVQPSTCHFLQVSAIVCSR